MLNLDEAGIAGLTVAVVAVAIAGASAGSAVAVDTYADQQPDSPLYGLERAGEAIKEITYAGGEKWNLARAEERTQEFEQMAKKNKAQKFEGLLDEAGNRFGKAVQSANRVKGLQRAENAIRKHIRVLENVRENVPEEAKAGISIAISRGVQVRATVAAQASGKKPGQQISEGERNAIEQELGEINREIQRIRDRVRENMQNARELGENVRQRAMEMVENVEIETARGLMNRVSEMVKENRRENCENLISGLAGEAQERLNYAAKAAVDNRGLERAIEASQKHLRVLEEVENKVPKAAKPGISLAMKHSTRHTQVLENIREKLDNGKFSPGQMRKEVNREVNRIREKMREKAENIRNQVQEAIKEGNWEEFAEEMEKGWKEFAEEMKDKWGDESDQDSKNEDNEKGKGPQGIL